MRRNLKNKLTNLIKNILTGLKIDSNVIIDYVGNISHRPGADISRRKKEIMKYSQYKKSIKKISSRKELERLLSIIEDDEQISDIGYENLRNLIIDKMYR